MRRLAATEIPTTKEQAMTTPEGERVVAAKTELAAATQAAKTAALEDLRRLVPEAEVARRYGVTRMTVRSWAGKPAGRRTR